jgi:hypothetical protein
MMKMAEDGLSAHSASTHGMLELYNKPSFCAFTRPLYLAYSGDWLDLIGGSPGVWPRVQNSGFSSRLDLVCRYNLLTVSRIKAI